MSIIPYDFLRDPFRKLEKTFEGLEEKFALPAVDVKETKKDVVVKVEAPAIDPNKIDIEIKNNYLYLAGKKEEKKEEKKENYYRKEIYYGSFRRVIPLPVEVKENKAKAEYKDGLLKIVIPKAKIKVGKGKKIKIKAK